MCFKTNKGETFYTYSKKKKYIYIYNLFHSNLIYNKYRNTTRNEKDRSD